MECSEQTLQNLEDAGCDEAMILEYRRIAAQPLPLPAINGKQAELLCGHRRKLLAEMHDCQRRIDCLDHLLYRLRTSKN